MDVGRSSGENRVAPEAILDVGGRAAGQAGDRMTWAVTWRPQSVPPDGRTCRLSAREKRGTGTIEPLVRTSASGRCVRPSSRAFNS